MNAGTGLLKGLQEGVLRLLEHRLRLAHDDELPAPFRCSEGEEGLHGRALVASANATRAAMKSTVIAF